MAASRSAGLAFYSGMPPEQTETITFSVYYSASGIDHMEWRSLRGVSLIKVYFRVGTDAETVPYARLVLDRLVRFPTKEEASVFLPINNVSGMPVWKAWSKLFSILKKSKWRGVMAHLQC
jgi:hypothetical protein